MADVHPTRSTVDLTGSSAMVSEIGGRRDDMPRILFVFSVALIAVPLLREQLAYFQQNNVRVNVVASPSAELAELCARSGARFHPVTISRKFVDPFADISALFALVRLLRRLRPSCVAAGTPKAALLACLAGRALRLPFIVYTMLGLRLEGERGVRRAVLWMLELLSCRMSHLVHVVGPDLRRRAIQLRLVDPARAVVVGAGTLSGIDVTRFVPRTSEHAVELRARIGLSGCRYVLGFVGRLTADKGLAVLLEVLPLLRQRLGRVGLLVVGAADESRAGDTELVGRLRAMPDVVMTGHRPDPETCYPAMDLLALPSLREGLPTVVLEAASCGVPTVMTRCTGAVDAVRDAVTGVTVPLGDVVAFAVATEHLLCSAKGREQMGRAARQLVLDRFDSRAVLVKVAELYSREPEPAPSGTAPAGRWS